MAGCVDESDVGSFERSTGMRVDDPDRPHHHSGDHHGNSHHGGSGHHGGGHQRASDEGTFRGATGADPALANMVLCSDGKLYEDCRNSPRGF
jgi:hypothetical protein